MIVGHLLVTVHTLIWLDAKNGRQDAMIVNRRKRILRH